MALLGQGGSKSASRAKSKYHKTKHTFMKEPLKFVADHLRSVKKELGIRRKDQPWDFVDRSRKISWGRFQSLFRVVLMLGAILRFTLDRQHQLAAAQAVQARKAIRQCVIDKGSWKIAWMLTYLPELRAQRHFGGNEAELEVISGYVRNIDELEGKVQKTKSSVDHREGDEEEDPDGEDPGEGERKPKGRGRGEKPK